MVEKTVERRKEFLVDREKFATQRTVTYVLLTIFGALCVAIFIGPWLLGTGNNESERSTIVQTVINLTLLAVGYWLGASKQGQDAVASQSRIAEAAPSVAAAVVANAAPPVPAATETMHVEAEQVNVTEEKPK